MNILRPRLQHYNLPIQILICITGFCLFSHATGISRALGAPEGVVKAVLFLMVIQIGLMRRPAAGRGRSAG